MWSLDNFRNLPTSIEKNVGGVISRDRLSIENRDSEGGALKNVLNSQTGTK